MDGRISMAYRRQLPRRVFLANLFEQHLLVKWCPFLSFDNRNWVGKKSHENSIKTHDVKNLKLRRWSLTHALKNLTSNVRINWPQISSFPFREVPDYEQTTNAENPMFAFSKIKGHEKTVQLSLICFKTLDSAATRVQVEPIESMYVKWDKPSFNQQVKHTNLTLSIWSLYVPC